MRLNNFFGKLFQIFDYLFRLVIINLLIVVPSFLFVFIMSKIFKDLSVSIYGILSLIPTFLYFFPAICASVELIRKYEMKECDTIFKEFFIAFKKNYVKALIESIIILVCVIIMYISVSYFVNNINNGILFVIGFILSVSFSFVILMVIINLPLVMNFMRGCLVIHDIKLSLMMVFSNVIVNVILAIMVILIIYISIISGFVLIIGAVSIPLYLIVKLSFTKYYIIYLRCHKE